MESQDQSTASATSRPEPRTGNGYNAPDKQHANNWIPQGDGDVSNGLIGTIIGVLVIVVLVIVVLQLT
jgi:hypothetical protein